MNIAFATRLVTVALVAGAAGCAGDTNPARDKATPQGAVSTIQGKLRPASLGTFIRSNFTDATQLVVMDSASWEQVWLRGFSGIRVFEKPEVNWQGQMVVVVGMGTRPRQGYSITVDSAIASSTELLIFVRYNEPGPACEGYGNRPTAPTQIVAFPRVPLPATFVESRHYATC